MAIAVSALTYDVTGNRRVTRGAFTGDTAYPTGGYAVAPHAIGLGTVENMNVNLALNDSSTTAIDAARYRISTGKLQFFDGAFAEIGNGTDLSAFSARFEAFGF